MALAAHAKEHSVALQSQLDVANANQRLAHDEAVAQKIAKDDVSQQAALQVQSAQESIGTLATENHQLKLQFQQQQQTQQAMLQEIARLRDQVQKGPPMIASVGAPTALSGTHPQAVGSFAIGSGGAGLHPPEGGDPFRESYLPMGGADSALAVSYTHLTLPTKA